MMKLTDMIERISLGMGIVTTILSLYTFNEELKRKENIFSLGKTYSYYLTGEGFLLYGAIAQRQRKKSENIQILRN